MRRKKHHQLHRHPSAVSREPTRSHVALRSDLLLRLRDQLQCTELRHQSTTDQWLLLDLSAARHNKHALHRLVSRLGRRRWHQRLHSLQLHREYTGTSDDRLQLRVRLHPSTACVGLQSDSTESAGDHSRHTRLRRVSQSVVRCLSPWMFHPSANSLINCPPQQMHRPPAHSVGCCRVAIRTPWHNWSALSLNTSTRSTVKASAMLSQVNSLH